MNLQEFYKRIPEQTSPKSDFITKVAKELNVSEATVRLWVYGKTRPRDEKHLIRLSELTGIPKDKLFAQ